MRLNITFNFVYMASKKRLTGLTDRSIDKHDSWKFTFENWIPNRYLLTLAPFSYHFNGLLMSISMHIPLQINAWAAVVTVL